MGCIISITHSGLRQTRDAFCPIHVMTIEVRYTRAEQERHDQRYRALVKSIGFGNTGDVEQGHQQTFIGRVNAPVSYGAPFSA